MILDNKKQALYRALIGALAGLGAHVLLGRLLGGAVTGEAAALQFSFPDCGFAPPWEKAGTALSFLLFAMLGAEVGLATLPFPEQGGGLLRRSLLHLAGTAATVAVWVGLNFRGRLDILAAFLIPLALIYALVWLGRWVGWYADVAAIRVQLGLVRRPARLKGRETLPYVPFALLLCLVLPLVLRLCDGQVPVLTILYAFVLLPVSGCISGFSLGRRHGICPLYPLIAAGLIAVFIPMARLFSNMADEALLPIALFATGLGNLTGAAVRRWRRTKGAYTGERK